MQSPGVPPQQTGKGLGNRALKLSMVGQGHDTWEPLYMSLHLRCPFIQ